MEKRKRGRPRKQKPSVVQNDLATAIGYNINNFPVNQGTPFSNQVSNATTIFVNLRWYLVSNFRQMLNEAYVEIGLVQTVCRVPVEDALRGGIKIQTSQLSPEEVEKLQSSIDRDDDLGTIGQAAIWNRLFGGAGVLILTDQDPELPLDLSAIGEDTPLEFRAVDMWELFWDKQNVENYDATIQQESFEFYNYYGQQVHKSRVMEMKGLTPPSFIRPRLRGWGFSVVETLVRSVNQYLKATDLMFEVLDEFKLDVYKIKNLVDTLMSPLGAEKILERTQLANWQKNYQHALVMDSEDDYDHKQLSFAGLAETMQQIRMQVAADMRMPLTKLFGISAAGFNSGEDDIEVYNAMVESEVRSKIKYIILQMVEIKCQKLFGYVPDDLMIDFKPLRVMSSEQEENCKDKIFQRLLAAYQAGQVSAKTFREACNTDKLLPVQLEDEDGIDLMNPDTGDTIKEEPTPETEGKPVDTNNPKDVPKADMKPAPSSNDPVNPQAKLPNTLDYDRRSFEAAGGESAIDTRRAAFIKDKGLWERAKQQAIRIYGKENLAFAIWYYRREGGKH